MRILKTELLSNEVSIVNLISDNEMIDVKELRVGNLVLGYCAYNDENDQEQEITNVCKVLSIDSVGAHEYPLWVEAIGKSNDVEEYDGFVPIPLTEEWLRKFNFKYYMKNVSGHPDKEHLVRRWQYKFFINGNEWWFDFEVDQQKPTNFFWLNWNFGGGNHFVHLPRKTEYVHQLQNLYFALTGK